MSSTPIRRRCSAILSVIFQARVLESKDAESCFYLIAAIGELLERDHPPHFHQLRYRDVILLRNPFDRVVADIVVHLSVFGSFRFNELFFCEMPLGYLRTLAPNLRSHKAFRSQVELSLLLPGTRVAQVHLEALEATGRFAGCFKCRVATARTTAT